jgi:hypothetical protein
LDSTLRWALELLQLALIAHSQLAEQHTAQHPVLQVLTGVFLLAAYAGLRHIPDGLPQSRQEHACPVCVQSSFAHQLHQLFLP